MRGSHRQSVAYTLTSPARRCMLQKIAPRLPLRLSDIEHQVSALHQRSARTGTLPPQADARSQGTPETVARRYSFRGGEVETPRRGF